LMNIKNRRGPNTDLVVLHWLLVVDLTFHHPVKPVDFCLTGRILPISRCYLLFHNSPFSSVVYYLASNYRPVSLTCICCKILEHIFVTSILNHLDAYKILVD
jgi:hypothetical protein